MCKKAFQSLFGGGADAPGIVQPAAAARPVGAVVKNTDSARDPNSVISSKKGRKDDQYSGVPGLGL